MLTFEWNGQQIEVEFEGEAGYPATFDEPESLGDFYLTTVFINGNDFDLFDFLTEETIFVLTDLAEKQLQENAANELMERQLTGGMYEL